jgi:hypothetical protein
VATPTSADLASFVGSAVNDDQATAVLSVIVALASSYTRGGGFTAGEPNDDVRAVILSASVRLLRDPSQIVAGETMGPFAITYRAGFDGWSVAELGVLKPLPRSRAIAHRHPEGLRFALARGVYVRRDG